MDDKTRSSDSHLTRLLGRNLYYRLSGLLRHELAQNARSLYGVQFANYILPLLTIPYLARVLGSTGWGLVAFAQAFGTYVALIGEYGFALSATREVARHRDDREKLADILGGVLGAKGLLASLAVAAAMLARGWIPIFRDHPLLFWGAVLWALGQAVSMMWFFLGMERVKLAAAADIATKSLATAAIFVFVRRPGDDWRVLIIQGLGFLLASSVCLALAYRTVPFRFPNWNSIREALRAGWGLFLFESSVNLNIAANTFILGLFVPPALVGFYAGAEKIARASLRLLDPVAQSLYPRVSHLVTKSKEHAARLARIGLAVMGTGGIALGAFVFFLAPEVIRLLLGPEYGPAVPVLRILALLPVLVALNKSLGGQWLIPLGLERPFNVIIVVSGLIRLGLAVVLARPFAAVGMAWVAVAGSAMITCGICFLLHRRGLNPIAGQMGFGEGTS